MDQNNGLEAKITEEETRTTPTKDLGEVPLLFTRTSPDDPTSHMGTAIQKSQIILINAQNNHSIGMMETDLEMDLSATRMRTAETMETFPVLHQLKGETPYKIIPIANQEVIGLTTLLSTDLTIGLRLVSCSMNKSFRKTIIRHYLMWFVSPQSTIPLTNCRTFAR